MTRRVASEAERKLFQKAFAEARPVGLAARKPARARRSAPTAKLDLHGYTEDAAWRALETFLHRARAHGDRLVLVVTGKGAPADPHAPFELDFDGRTRGVLRNRVPRWLAEPPFRALVAEIAPAPRRHGGDGALYVYLKAP